MLRQAIRKYNIILDKIPVEFKKNRRIITSQDASDIMCVISFLDVVPISKIPTLAGTHMRLFFCRSKLAGRIVEGGGKF